MLARINTITFNGLEILDVDLQIQVTSGLPAFNIVGLPDKAIAESRERVRAALQSIGLALPAKHITINLSPADLYKEGSHFDLPVALGLMAVMGVIPNEMLLGYIALGELGLDGSIIPVNGVLPVAIKAARQGKGLICPQAQGSEAAWSGLKEIVAADNLLSLINHFKGTQLLPYPRRRTAEARYSGLDMSEVKGQESAKRAFEIAAAGGHNLLMVGPPGSGKSMLAARMPTILPPLSPEEALETSMIHSVAGINGVLFLDELPEFSRPTLEALRQPLENGTVSISRVHAHTTFPARFQLIAAMNPCRCGYLGSKGQECARAPLCAAEYQAKLSGPLLDRIDMYIEVPAVSPWDLANVKKGESSETIRSRVVAARTLQKQRFIKFGHPELHTNAELNGEILEKIAGLDDEAKSLLISFSEKNKLSARSYHRIIRLSRTIADLQNKINVSRIHVAEALSYRRILPNKRI